MKMHQKRYRTPHRVRFAKRIVLLILFYNTCNAAQTQSLRTFFVFRVIEIFRMSIVFLFFWFVFVS